MYFSDTLQTELLDSFSEKEEMDLLSVETQSNDDKIGFRDATFTWSNDADGSLTPSKRKFALRVEGELLFERGHINLIIGPTGSGKTSLLMALLGIFFYLIYFIHLMMLFKARCISYLQDPIHGIIFLEAQESHMLHRNRGCKMKQ